MKKQLGIFSLIVAMLGFTVLSPLAASAQEAHEDEQKETHQEEERVVTPLGHPWDIVSMQAIDQALVDSGREPMFDPSDPLYTMTVEEIADLSEHDLDLLFEEEEFAEEQEEALEILEMLGEEGMDVVAAIEAVRTATTFDELDAIYDGLSEELRDAIDEMYDMDDEYEEFDPAYEEAIDKVISEDDWDTLTLAEIDAKLVAAGLEPLFDPADPTYHMTEQQVDAMTDEEFDALMEPYWEQFDEEYGHEDYDDYEDEDEDDEDEWDWFDFDDDDEYEDDDDGEEDDD